MVLRSRYEMRHGTSRGREKLRPRCAHRSGTGAPNGQKPKNRPKHSRASSFGWSLAQPSAAASRQGGRMRLGPELAFALTDPPQSLTLTRSPRRRLKKGSAAILERATRWPQTCSIVHHRYSATCRAFILLLPNLGTSALGAVFARRLPPRRHAGISRAALGTQREHHTDAQQMHHLGNPRGATKWATNRQPEH